jgi:cellulose synthase operon protein C
MMPSCARRGWVSAALGLCLFVVLACGGATSPEAPSLTHLRQTGPSSEDPELVARWLVGEMLSPGGTAKGARRARERLDTFRSARGPLAHLARGLDDQLHGHPAAASDHYLRAVEAARDAGSAEAPLVAWFGVNRALALRHETTGLWQRWRGVVERAIAEPRGIGWRARSELVEWALEEAWTSAAQDVKTRAVEQFGCLTEARLAGPFGRGTPADATRSFAPERPGPWPTRWEREAHADRRPRTMAASGEGCSIAADESPGPGIFYVESFIELDDPQEILLAIQGALAVWVDDTLVLERDLRQWAVWPRFGAQLMLPAGRHRIVARLGAPSTSVRVMRPDGTPLDVRSSADARAPYAPVPPRVTAEPNLLSRYVRGSDVVDPGDDLGRFVAAYLAHIESSDDLASVLLEPLVRDTSKATGPALTTAALFAEGDPLFDRGQTEDLVRELHERALERDPLLWQAALSRALGSAQRQGTADAVTEIEGLAKRFPEVSAITLALARVYGELGWNVEHRRTVLRAAERFPNDLEALHAAVEIHDAEGAREQADALMERIRRLDQDSEITLTRALAREDYAEALTELQRMAKRRPERKDLAERIHDVMVRAGNTSETWKKLEAAVDKDPTSGRDRLELADARFASGQHDALRRALAEAVVAGADTSLLSSAIDLVEGMTALEPYRLDPEPIIAAYEASGQHMPGSAARVLDYAAIWARADGSSQMLEHEIIRLQSAEGIQKFAEHRRLEGLVLRMRVIKQDGTTLEPEDVAGKPTVTFPHLEVGDYIETEQVVFLRGDGFGNRYLGPRWFFREENVAYARSELLVITPRHANVVIETTGAVPAPEVVEEGALVSRRWRVDFSPAAPVEPHGVPITEFLPSVRVGWGVNLAGHLARLSDAVADTTPTDPRIVRIARRIVEDVPRGDTLAKARRLYRWVLDNVESGEESDGRRVIVSKNGNRWRGFLELCAALGIDAQYAVAKNRLAPPPEGPISQAALFTEPVIRIAAGKQQAWVSLNQKFAPFGYVPAEVRGMPAYLLGTPPRKPVRIPESGDADGLWFEGAGKLLADGSLELELVERFTGKLAMALRTGISQLPEERLRAALEANLLQRALSGARLKDFSIEARDDLDAPLAVRMKITLERFARFDGKRLVISPPFVLALSTLTALPARQTPLLIGEAIHRRVDVTFELPRGATVDAPPPQRIREAGRLVERNDTVTEGKLRLRRIIEVPAGRVQPRDYKDFARFAERADELQTAPVVVKL